MITGSFTALVTPFKGDAVDDEGLERLIHFQMKNGINGILAVGTTGESPVLTWEEHNEVIEKIREETKGKCKCIAGAGSNSTKEALAAAKHAAECKVDAILLVDPYYNGPSSIEIRREYVAPIAEAIPNVEIIPYVIPGRTGTQLFPQDLAILGQNFQNVKNVKEATGSLDNMRRTRACCGKDYSILSGDDNMTFSMMTAPDIKGNGVISVVSNVAPKAVSDMVRLLTEGKTEEAKKINDALDPLFGLVAVKTDETTPFGQVSCKARNPLPIKTLMTLLGMPAGGCRQPLGKMTLKGLNKVLEAAKKTWANHPEILKPVETFFGVSIEKRLNNPSLLENLYYKEY